MKGIRLTIGNKILLGFSILIVFFAGTAMYSILTIQKNGEVISENMEVIDPSVSKLNELNHMVTRSKMLVTNWVYMYRNVQDQQKLDSLQRFEYPALRHDLSELSKQWADSTDEVALKNVFVKMDSVIGQQRVEIMDNLRTFEDYEDSMIKFMAEEVLSSAILPQMATLQTDLETLIATKIEEKVLANNEQISSFDTLQKFTIFLGVLVIAIGIVTALIIARRITLPVKFMKEIVYKLSQGELPQDSNRSFSNDEIGEMAEALDKLVVGLKSTSNFAASIGNGQYNAEFAPLSESDVLGNSLIEMRDNLQKVAEADKRRNWATEGLAMFGDILRKQNEDINTLCDNILSNLVKYVNANQGGLYIVNDDIENDPYLEMAACYAWDKKKYLEQKVQPGDGLTGQAWLEKETIYLTDIPENYITITSGLGEANPTSILIVPLKLNDEVYGLLEVASFNVFAEHEVEFVERIAESIASTLSSAKINERTQKLLEESQELTEQMRSQEEEMRQNMEELQATQEEMERGQQDRQEKESIINATSITLELDEQMRIELVNALATQTLMYGEGELKGKAFSQILASADELTEIKRVTEEDHIWTGVLNFKCKNGDAAVVKASVGRTRNPYSNSYKYLILATNITGVVQDK